MFKIFKEKEPTPEPIVKSITSEDIKKDMWDLIDSIQAPETLKTNQLKADNQHITQKANKLVELGFSNTPSVQLNIEIENKHRKEVEHVDLLKKEKKLISEYQKKYPLYKFVPERIFEEILTKYNLYYAVPKKYIKEIPDKNLEEIERFSENHDEKIFVVTAINKFVPNFSYKSLEEAQDKYDSELKFASYYPSIESIFQVPMLIETSIVKEHIRIAAPADHFNLEKTTVERREIVESFSHRSHINKDGIIETVIIKDPIVFLKQKGGIVIITAWDKEADIPEIQNPLNN